MMTFLWEMHLNISLNTSEGDWPWPTFQGHRGNWLKILVNTLSHEIFHVWLPDLYHRCTLQKYWTSLKIGDLDLLSRSQAYICEKLVDVISREILDIEWWHSYERCVLKISQMSDKVGDLDLLFKVREAICWKSLITQYLMKHFM